MEPQNPTPWPHHHGYGDRDRSFFKFEQRHPAKRYSPPTQRLDTESDVTMTGLVIFVPRLGDSHEDNPFDRHPDGIHPISLCR